jgi:hypothetical protein
MTDSRSTPEYNDPSHDEIARLAYFYWEARGRPEDSPEIDWLRAEEDLGRSRREHVEYRPERMTISDTHID